MPRQKQPGKADKHAKRKPSAPETEDEFLEAADELEKSGGKWRAGDAAKAVRFFQRAIDTYNTGLQRYPRSFDLAYNKALLQYQMTQDHRIAFQLGDPVNLLRETLESHRYARQLNEENADILFNTAQVLTSLAEARAENVQDAESRSDAVRLLQEAVELFSACLTRQEMEYSEQQAAAVEAASTATDTNAEDARDTTDTVETSPDSPEAELWATVVEPVTPGTLLETALAQLSALSTLVSLVTSSTVSALGFIRELASPLLVTKIPSYLSLISTDCPNPIKKEEPPSASARSISVTEPSPQPVADATQEPPPHVTAALAISAYTAAIADAEYRAGLTTADDYGARLTNAYEPLLSEDRYQAALSKPFTAVLGAYADALSDLASSRAGLGKAKHKSNVSPSFACYHLEFRNMGAVQLQRLRKIITTIDGVHTPPFQLRVLHAARSFFIAFSIFSSTSKLFVGVASMNPFKSPDSENSAHPRRLRSTARSCKDAAESSERGMIYPSAHNRIPQSLIVQHCCTELREGNRRPP